MTNLDKADLSQRDEMASRLRDTFSDLDKAVDQFNAAMATAWEQVEGAVTAHNEAISDANAFKNDVAQEMQEYYDNRTEKWQEGDRGQAYLSWKETWEEDFEEAAPDKPDDLDISGLEDYAEMLEQLPKELVG